MSDDTNKKDSQDSMSKHKESKSTKNKEGTYGGYGANSSTNITGAINEFEDNLNVDWNDERADNSNSTSVINRITPKSKTPKKQWLILNKIFKLLSIGK